MRTRICYYTVNKLANVVISHLNLIVDVAAESQVA